MPTFRPQAFWLFFPAAALLAAAAVPLSVWAVLGGGGWPSGLLNTGHGHEMIFGFALALIAGYTLGRQSPERLYLLFALWLAARISWWFMPDTLLANALSPAFALALAAVVLPRFHAAKKWRNKMVGPLIGTVAIMAVAFGLSRTAIWQSDLAELGPFRIMHAAIIGLLLLMTFMGGRILAPSVANTLDKKGVALNARLQPRMEGTLIILLAAALLFSLIPPLRHASGALLVAAALVTAIRLTRWKLWRCLERPDLMVFAVGYSWLVVGGLLSGIALLSGRSMSASLHMITIGALGTLAGSVMLKLAWQRACRQWPPAKRTVPLAIAIGAATLLRFAAGTEPFSHPQMLWCSAALWAGAWLLMALELLRLSKMARQRVATSTAST
jgi:uncharacterized protein involved in response to NO